MTILSWLRHVIVQNVIFLITSTSYLYLQNCPNSGVALNNPIAPYVFFRKRSYHSFVNISSALVIDASMERSSWVLHHGNSKIWKFSQKNLKFKYWLVFWLELKSWNHLSFVNISPTLVIGKVFTRTAAWKPINLKIFPKKFAIRILSCDEELKSL